VFRTSSWLREITISIFDPRILIAVPELLRQANIAIVMMLFAFRCAFGAVWVVL